MIGNLKTKIGLIKIDNSETQNIKPSGLIGILLPYNILVNIVNRAKINTLKNEIKIILNLFIFFKNNKNNISNKVNGIP